MVKLPIKRKVSTKEVTVMQSWPLEERVNPSEFKYSFLKDWKILKILSRSTKFTKKLQMPNPR